MNGIISFGVIAVIFALASEDVFATIGIDPLKPGDDASIDQQIMDMDIKRSGMSEMNKFPAMGMRRKEEPCEDTISTKKCLKLKKLGKCKKVAKVCKKTCDICNDGQGLIGVGAQPLFKDQCSANEFVLNGLKGWKDADTLLESSCGWIKLLGCVTKLAGPIAKCLRIVGGWPNVPACVIKAIGGSASDCYPCVCAVINKISGHDVC